MREMILIMTKIGNKFRNRKRVMRKNTCTQVKAVHKQTRSLERGLPKISPSKMESKYKTNKSNQKKLGGRRRAKWSDEDLVAAIECCQASNIPRSSLRDHLSGRITTKKIGAKTILRKQEELITEYIDEMLKMGQSLTPQMVKLKVAEICQGRLIPFKDGIPRDSWLFLFKQRHLHLVIRILQGLEIVRARAMNPITIHGFYSSLL